MNLNEEKSHRSVSQLNKYVQCSEQYRLSYIDKPEIPFAPAAWLAQGTAFHETIRVWEESGRSQLVNIADTFHGFYDAEIATMKASQPDLTLWLKSFTKKTEQDILDRRDKGLQQVHEYILYANSNDFAIANIDDYTLGVEIPFEVTIGNTVVKGAIDQMWEYPKGLGVVDLKTGNRESAKIQLGIYKVAVEKFMNMPVVMAAFYYAKDSKLVTLTGRDLARYTEDYVSDLLSALDRGIQQKVFLPNPGQQCTMCPVKKYCREWN